MITRREMIASSAAFAVAPLFARGSRLIKTPLMLDTKRMAIWDGPGLRTTFFVKGCPLKCIWCHNPESLKVESEWARFKHLCRNCAKCTMDEATCPTRALKLYGKAMSIDDIVSKALEDKPFYDKSGGGVTLSGGEPLFFWEWAAELFAAFKKAGLHTCLDTSLYAPKAAIDAMLPVTDMWLADYKAHDDEKKTIFIDIAEVTGMKPCLTIFFVLTKNIFCFFNTFIITLHKSWSVYTQLTVHTWSHLVLGTQGNDLKFIVGKKKTWTSFFHGKERIDANTGNTFGKAVSVHNASLAVAFFIFLSSLLSHLSPPTAIISMNERSFFSISSVLVSAANKAGTA